MKNLYVDIILSILFTFIGFTSFCQIDNNEAAAPILLDKIFLSGVGLDTINLKNEPDRDFFQKRLYRGEDISIYIVSSESWTSEFDAFWFDEFIYILHGRSHVKTDDEDIYFESGEYFFAPKGFKGSWEVQVGEHHHYELSVITNQRSDTSRHAINQKPFLLDKTMISGANITFNENGLYSKLLAQDTELEVFLMAEKPSIKNLKGDNKEQLICLQSGVINFQDTSGKVHTFTTGDNFVIQKDLIGQWSSQGHGLVKYISVSKSSLQ